MLPEIVAACPEVPVMIDSGIRRGTDILKALALGAKFVFVGRSFGYAASVGGEAGVLRAIDILRVEIDRDMAMMGINRLDELTPDMPAPHPSLAARASARTRSYFTVPASSGDLGSRTSLSPPVAREARGEVRCPLFGFLAESNCCWRRCPEPMST